MTISVSQARVSNDAFPTTCPNRPILVLIRHGLGYPTVNFHSRVHGFYIFIMVFKTAYFSLDNQPLWISDWFINAAIKIGFILSDKYIYIDWNAIGAVTSTQRRATMPHMPTFLFSENKSATGKRSDFCMRVWITAEQTDI